MSLQPINPALYITDTDPVNESTINVSGWYTTETSSTQDHDSIPFMMAQGWKVVNHQSVTYNDGTITHYYTLSRRVLMTENVLQSLITSQTRAYNEGRKLNDTRYDEIVTLYSLMLDKTETELNSITTDDNTYEGLVELIISSLDTDFTAYDTATSALMVDFGASELLRINTKFNAMIASQKSGLINRGMYNSTIWTSVEAGVERERAFAITDLNDKINERQLTVEERTFRARVDVRLKILAARDRLRDQLSKGAEEHTVMRNRVMDALLAFMERRTDSYPDLTAQAKVVSDLGAGSALSGTVNMENLNSKPRRPPMFRSMANTPFNPRTGQYWAMGYPDMFKSFFVKEQLNGDVILCEDGKGNLLQVGLPHNMQQSVYEAYGTTVFSDGLTYTWGSIKTTKNSAGEIVGWQQERVVAGESSSSIPVTEKITPAYKKDESILCIKISNDKDSNVKWLDINTAGRFWVKESDSFPHRSSDPWAVILNDYNASATVINAGLTGVSGAWMEAAPLYVTAAGYVYGMLVQTTPGYWSFSTHFTTSLSDTVESVADIEAGTVKVKAFEFELADIGSGKKAVRIKRDWIHGGIYVDKSASASDVIPLVDSGGGVAGESISVSRDDHQHPANVDSLAPEAIGSAGASGSATTYAKRDHVHAGAALGAAIPLEDSGTGSAGTAEAASREDHVHPPDIELSDVAPPWSSEASAGESELAARSDHGHYIPLGAYLPHPLQQAAFTPLVDVVDGVIGGVGLYQEGAFFDHQHPTNVDDTDPEDIAAVASPGTSGIYARRDHVHAGTGAVGDTTPKVDITDGEVGTATSASREDHQHPLNVDEIEPEDVGTVASTGTESTYARRDHVHKGGSGAVGDATPKVDITDGKVGSATSASREDHQHPLNVDSTNPGATGTTASPGTADTYARIDHVHRDRYPSLGTGLLSLVSATEGLANADQRTWGNGISGGATVGDVDISVVTRVRYNENDATPQIRCFYRKLRIDPFGRVISVSGEGAYTVDVPSTLVLS